MRVQISNFLMLVFIILRDVCHGTILCSQCYTKENPECEEKPPESQPCFDPGDGIPQTCSVIRTYDAGKQIDFIRSCSNTVKSGCIEDPTNGHKICAEICTTDYCNGPSSSPLFLYCPWLLCCAVLTGLFMPKMA